MESNTCTIYQNVENTRPNQGDTTNPSILDAYFPRFRCFDWFDLHSWSRGVVPSSDGKDQESTSEELNLLYGIQSLRKRAKTCSQ